MGMFDYLLCKYPLPVPGANALRFQTKDTPKQFLDLYEIREDGSLWYEDYDVEDRSKVGIWEREHPGEPIPKEMQNSLDSFCGSISKVNQRWVPVPDFDGDLVFYTNYALQDGIAVKTEKYGEWSGWIELRALYNSGKLVDMKLVENRLPE